MDTRKILGILYDEKTNANEACCLASVHYVADDVLPHLVNMLVTVGARQDDMIRELFVTLDRDFSGLPDNFEGWVRIYTVFSIVPNVGSDGSHYETKHWEVVDGEVQP